MPSLTPMLHATSVALVGISLPERFGGRLYAYLRGFGYQGTIYAVNPRYPSLYGETCYPSLNDLPARPDCAVLAVPDSRLLDVMEEAASLGVPSAVIFGLAYSAPSPGQPTLQERLTAVARAGDMSLCGPNCMGFISVGQRLAVTGYPVPNGVPSGGIALISHSGSVFDALLQNNRQVYYNYVVSSGNEIVTSLADYMHFVLADRGTRVLALFLETIRDPQGFVAALAEAAERDVPVVALKVGRSQQGARLAQAHSGALAGEDAVYDALFAHYGVQRVKSLDEMMDTLELLAAGFRTPTRYVSAILDSGGERAMLADLAESEGVTFAPINEATRDRLAATLDPGLAPINPLDAWGTGNEYDRIYGDCLLALDSDPATGLNLFVVDLSREANIPPTYVDIALGVQSRLTKPLVFLTNLTATVSEMQSATLRKAGIPVLMGTETGLRAARHLLDYSEFQRRRAALQPEPDRQSPACLEDLRWELEAASGALDEQASRHILQAYGIRSPQSVVAAGLEEALAAAQRIGYPVALKTAAGVAHKSDQGGVHLDLRDSRALTAAYRNLGARLGPPMLVQQMVSGGVEVILGLVHDPAFGMLLALGMGGILVEILKDSRLLLLPASREAVREALLSLRGAALLRGARGRTAVDVEAVVEAAVGLAALAADLGDLIAAVDVNPLIAQPDGALAVDALIVKRET
jgi:acyl-CoA synthetase (NDP forming)